MRSAVDFRRLVRVHDYQNKNPLHPLRIYTIVCLCMQVYLYPCKCCRYRLYSHAMLAFVFKPFQTQPFPPKMVHIKSRNYNIFKYHEQKHLQHIQVQLYVQQPGSIFPLDSPNTRHPLEPRHGGPAVGGELGVGMGFPAAGRPSSSGPGWPFLRELTPTNSCFPKKGNSLTL